MRTGAAGHGRFLSTLHWGGRRSTGALDVVEAEYGTGVVLLWKPLHVTSGEARSEWERELLA